MNKILIIIAIIFCFLQILVLISGRKIEDKVTKKKLKDNMLVSVVLFAAICTFIYQLNVFSRVYLADGFKSVIVALLVLEAVVLIYSVRLIRQKNIVDESNKADSEYEEDKADVNVDNSLSQKEDERSYLSRLKLVISQFLYISYTVLILGVFEPYFSNINEWSFSYKALIIPALVIGGGFLVLAFIIPLFLLGKKLNRLSLILSAVCILCYIQKMFLNESFLMSGNYLESTWRAIIIGTIIWSIVLLTAGIIKADVSKVKIMCYITLFLLLIQLPVLPFIFIKGAESIEENSYDYALDGLDQFQVGSEENVIVFIMDAFYSKYFMAFLVENPEYVITFSDFTYYDNMSSRTNATAFSMPNILTGKDVDCSIPLTESNANAWNGDTATYFYDLMHEEGYNVGLYTDNDLYCGGAENMLGKVDNIKMASEKSKDPSFNGYSGMLKIALFNVSPVMIKNCFCILDSNDINKVVGISDDLEKSEDWMAQSDSAMNRGICFYNNDYYKNMMTGLKTDKYEKRIIFQHIMGMHTPLEPIDGLEYSANSNLEMTIEGCVRLFEAYVDQLKELGVYDSSTIILTADHGLSKVYECIPIMMIKPAYSSAEYMTINHGPGEVQSDLLPTIIGCLNRDVPDIYEGVSLLDIDENTERTRIARIFTHLDDYPDSKKCNGVGTSKVNAYYEMEFTGRIDEYEFGGAPCTIHPVTSYWW